MALYATTDAGGHVAKRARVEFHPAAAAAAAALHLQTTTAAPAPPVVASPIPTITPSTPTPVAAVAAAGILSQQYIEQQLNRKSNEPEKPNHILLFTVLNPTYPVTCDVLHTICSPLGTVRRIVIFKKNGVQAMVEFDSVDTAKQAKAGLHGCDIYSGCCTLKIEYAKPTKLNVYKNDTDSWDYTNPNLGKQPIETPQVAVSTPSQRPVLLKEPTMMASSSSSSPTATDASTSQPQTVVTTQQAALLNGSTTNLEQIVNAAAAQQHITSTTNNNTLSGLLSNGHHQAARAAALSSAMLRPSAAAAATTLIAPAAATSPTAAAAATSSATAAAAAAAAAYQHHQGSVCMVYGLSPDKMNANRIFNLFCLYGNVVRVKFLKTKEGCAMVQMGDGLAVERVVSNLNNSTFFGSKMQLGFSKQAFLADVQSPYQLSDGTNSFQDFMGSKNNRFINPEMASKNRIQPPSKILHFFNTPPGLSSNDIEDIFTGNGSPKPKCVKMFPSKTERSSSGLIEFETLAEALEGLVTCNHQPIPNPNGKFPYIMKLCFSSSRSIPATIR